MNALEPDRIVGAAVWRFAYLLVQGAFSLVLFVAVAQVLPADALPPTSLALGVLVLAQALGDFGLSQAAVTTLPARAAADRERTADLLAGAARAFVMAAGIALAITLLATAVVPASARLSVACVAPAAAVTVLVAGADGLLRATGEFRRPVVLVAVSRLGAFAGVPAALSTDSATATCAAISAGTLAGSIPAIVVLLGLLHRGQADSARAFATAALPLGLSVVFILAGSRLNTLLLAAFSSVTAAAVFEAAWRLYQLGQYAVGSLATAIAPFAADALGGGRRSDLRRLVRRTLGFVVGAGLVFAIVVLLVRDPLAELLFDELGDPAARALVPLALVTPLSLAGLVAMFVLGAAEGHRRRLPEAFAVGAAVNLVLLPVLAGGASGGAQACAAGLAVTNAWLLVRLAQLMRHLDAVPDSPARLDVAELRPGP